MSTTSRYALRPRNATEAFVLVFSLVTPFIFWSSCIRGFEICFNDAGWADYRLHYTAINSYLNSPEWLPAFTYAFTWPSKTSLLYSDSYPLPSLLLWPIYRFIKFPTGIIFPFLSILNSFAIGYSSILISRNYNLPKDRLLALSFFLLFSPISWSRLLAGHESLQLHSLVILPLILLLLNHKRLITWTLLLVLTLGINAYYLPFAFCSFCILTLWPLSPRLLFKSLLRLMFVLGLCTLTLFLCGYIPGYQGNTSDVWGANMLSLLDPQGTSSLLEAIPISDPYEQEGYSYLGIGLILLILTTALSSVSPPSADLRTRFLQATFLSVLFVVVSWGLVWNISTQPIVTPYLHLGIHSLLVSFYGIFRSCGRFTWPLYYLLIIWALSMPRQRSTRSLLLIAILIQLLELVIPLASRISHTFNSRVTNGVNPSKTWITQNQEVANMISKSSYFIVFTDKKPSLTNLSMPPYTPQLINPSIYSNWGGVNLSRRPSRIIESPDQLLSIPPGQRATIYLGSGIDSIRNMLQRYFIPIEKSGSFVHVIRRSKTLINAPQSNSLYRN